MKYSFWWVLILPALLLNDTGESATTPNLQPNQGAKSHNPGRNSEAQTNKAESSLINPGTKEATGKYTYKIENYYYNSADGWNWPAIIAAGSTLGLVLFAAWQMCFVRRTTKATEVAAQAAQKSAEAVDASLHVYRPFIVIRKPTVDSTQIPQLHRRVPTAVKIKVRNYGIGPADVINYFVRAEVFDWAGDDPPAPVYSENESCHTIDSVIKPEGENELATLWFDISQNDFTAILNDRKRLAFHGIIYYRGGPEKIYWTRFFWWCILSVGEEIVRAKTPELNAHI